MLWPYSFNLSAVILCVTQHWPKTKILRHEFSLETMPADRFNGLTEYGVGIGLRIPHH